MGCRIRRRPPGALRWAPDHPPEAQPGGYVTSQPGCRTAAGAPAWRPPARPPSPPAAPSPSRVRARPRVRARLGPSTPPPPQPAAPSPQRRCRCHIVENVTARAVPAPGSRHWPKRSLICIPGGPGLRAPRVYWLQRPSLSLHKSHMELHVHRVRSSMKTRRARPPLLVLPSGPFHFRPRHLPFKTAGVRRLGERRVARTTAARGSWARDGTGSRAPQSGPRG